MLAVSLTPYYEVEQVKIEADHLFRRAEEAYDACTFPNQPDHEAVSALTMDILKDYWCEEIKHT